MGVGEALGKSYGPLPGGAWLVLVFGGAFIFIKRAQQQKATNTKGGGNATFAEGANKQVQYTTSSNYTGYFGPGAGGNFEGTYAPGPINSNNDTVNAPGGTVNAPFSGAHMGVRPDHPHRHHNYTRREHDWPDGAYMDHGVLHDKHGNHIGGGKRGHGRGDDD